MDNIIEFDLPDNNLQDRLNTLRDMRDKLRGYLTSIEEAIDNESDTITMESSDLHGDLILSFQPTKLCVLLSDDQNLLFDGLDDFNFMELLCLRSMIIAMTEGD